MSIATLPARLIPPPAPPRLFAEWIEAQMSGGRVLQVTSFKRQPHYAWIWCVHPVSQVERSIKVWNDGTAMPQLGDFVWWVPQHSPQWVRAGKHVKFLPRIGPSVDPVTGKP